MKIKECKKALTGQVNIAPDKSISHRAIICGALAEGETLVHNLLLSEDVLNTIACFRQLGVSIDIEKEKVKIQGLGTRGLRPAPGALDCGNSGTSIRLLSGVLVGQDFSSSLLGDSSLMQRPMARIISPLTKMGANIRGVKGEYPPLEIEAAEKIQGIEYLMPVASAQVKSAILLASLYGDGRTKIIEKQLSRDHTERILQYFGVNLQIQDKIITMENGQNLKGRELFVPGDISSAAYFIVAALLMEGSHLLMKNIGLNPTRDGLIYVLRDMGGHIRIYNKRLINNEPVGDIEVKYSPLKSTIIEGDIIARLIDELPIIALAASLAQGKTLIKDAGELRYKETDRIRAISSELGKMGANIGEKADGMIIEGRDSLRAGQLKSYGDHRIAMTLSIAALKAKGESRIEDYESVSISYPDFYTSLEKLYL